MERYKEECKLLADLAFQQLNLIKNRDKGDLEESSFITLVKNLKDEAEELENEFLDFFLDKDGDIDFTEEKSSHLDIDFDRVLEEVGDVAAFLVGIVSKVQSLKRAKNG